MFYKINSLINIANKTIALDTINAGYVTSSNNSIRVGDIIFWKRNIKNGNYGHVAIVVYVANGTVVIAQQNRSKIFEEYDTSDIIREMNKPCSQFLGIKRLPIFVIIPQQIQIQTN
jgi:surface antigen